MAGVLTNTRHNYISIVIGSPYSFTFQNNLKQGYFKDLQICKQIKDEEKYNFTIFFLISWGKQKFEQGRWKTEPFIVFQN